MRPGRRGRTITVRRPRPGERARDIDWSSTVKESLLRRAGDRTRAAGKPDWRSARRPARRRGIRIRPEDLRVKVRRQTLSVCVVFVVDASDSMGSRRRLAVVKGSVLALLRRAYQRRHTVAVVAFGGEHGRLLLRPTAGVSVARRALLKLRPEGATPMASGIERALEVLHRVEARGLAEVKIAAVLSDGEANVPLQPGGDPQEDVLRMLPRLRSLADETVFIDTKRPDRSGRTEMQRFARAAGGRWYGPGHLTAGSLLSAVERAERAGGEK